MKVFRGSTSVLVASLLLVAAPIAALAGATHLTVSKEKKVEADLHAYDRLVVTDFTDASQPKFDKPEDEAEYRKTVAEGGRRIAEMIVAKLAPAKGFKELSRAPLSGKHLILSGEITVYKESNAVARYIGLGFGGSEFDATIDVKDGESGTVLGTMSVAIGSSPVPGATNAVETVGFLMDSTAQTVRDELLIASHKLHREETGRSGRAREKYAHPH